MGTTIKLKDGRSVRTDGFGENFWVTSKKGEETKVGEKYYNKCKNQRAKT
jgi:hypothetical protein